MQRTEINDELDNLKTSDPLLPPDLDATGALEVVPVHDDVDHEVERDNNPRDRGRSDQLSVAEESGGAVVVAVEEGEGLLLEEEEAGIQKLEVLGEVVELENEDICVSIGYRLDWGGHGTEESRPLT